MRRILISLFLTALLLSACGGGKENTQTDTGAWEEVTVEEIYTFAKGETTK